MTELLIIAISSALVSNVVLSQFLGICSFVGVSKKVETAAGMGGAVIFVITIASIVASLIYDFVLAPLGMDYLKDDRVHPCNCGSGADCRDVPEEMYGIPVQRAGRVPSADHHQLCGARCGNHQRAERLQLCTERGKRCGYRCRLHHRHRASGWYP